MEKCKKLNFSDTTPFWILRLLRKASESESKRKEFPLVGGKEIGKESSSKDILKL